MYWKPTEQFLKYMQLSKITVHHLSFKCRCTHKGLWNAWTFAL